jgi:hypothetical protein
MGCEAGGGCVSELIVSIGLAEPELLESFIDEHVREIKELTDRCYDCGDEPCVKHAQLVEEFQSDAAALLIGMITFKVCAE